MIDVIDALVELLEPAGPGRILDVDDSAAQPNEWKPNTLYGFPVADRFEQAGTGAIDRAGEIIERFEIRLVLTAPNPGEEPSGGRDRDVSLKLDSKADEYLTAIVTHETGQAWDNLTATVDHDWLRQFEIRGVSLVCSGYRFRSS